MLKYCSFIMNFHTDFMDNMQVEKVLNGEKGKITLLKTVNHFFSSDIP